MVKFFRYLLAAIVSDTAKRPPTEVPSYWVIKALRKPVAR